MSALDRFSKQSKEYAAARPTYPEELFQFLAAESSGRHLAWDCGTGNGQAAVRLADYFEKVYATDISAAQLEKARPHKNIQYEKSSETSTILEDESVDLVTVAQAVHWFDLEKFYEETNRVLRQQGVIALWGYGFISAADEKVDRVFQKLGREILEEYWDKNVNKIWSGYGTLVFPYDEIVSPAFVLETEWSRDQFINYVSSWSAAQKFKDKNNCSVLELVWEELMDAWKNPDERHSFSTPLTIRVGRKT